MVPFPLPQPVGDARAGMLVNGEVMTVWTGGGWLQSVLRLSPDCDGRDPALLSAGLERSGGGFGHRSVGSGSVSDRHKAGGHTEKHTSEQELYILSF